ncbi:MAG: hypothetical protein RSG77_21735 [Hafnia sp.]
MPLSMIAETIVSQMGGRNRLTAMTGAKYAEIADGYGVQIILPDDLETKNGVNRVDISLNTRTDTYDMVFNRLEDSGKIVQVYSTDDIYADNLQSVFSRHTGLATHL